MAGLFEKRLQEDFLSLERTSLETLQVNIGKRCNQACFHCHVESSPTRTENMELSTVDRLLDLLAREDSVRTVDITGGAPELNPHFRHFVRSIVAMGKEVIDRCNLTVLFEPGQEDTASFLAEQGVQVVASLPCYLQDNVDAQRGKGVFDKSIRALQQLNALGYGVSGSGLLLHLVYNPVGEHLPPPQAALQADYHEYLLEHFQIVFNQLFTITNMPIKRYRKMLERQGSLQEYMQLLLHHFNADALTGVMCRQLVSVGWDGQVYDCDFNQMLDMPIGGVSRSIWDVDRLSDFGSKIAVGDHCFGCTAGAGSSCTGALLEGGQEAQEM